MKDHKRNILILSLYFSPSAEIGGKRFSFLSQVFQEKYFNVHILTLPEHYFSQKDYSINCNARVHRVPMLPFITPFPWSKQHSFFKKLLTYLWGNYLSLIDIYSGWIIPSFLKGLEIIKKHKIDTIVVSGPPFSPMVSAYLIRRFTGAKLILDYRDPWTVPSADTRYYPKPFGKKLNYLLEKCAVKRASSIVFVTDTMRDDFINHFGDSTKDRCFVINNGFHPIANNDTLHLEKDKKVILYQGRFYTGKSIWLILAALSELIRNGETTIEDFRIHLFGEPIPSSERDKMTSIGLDKTVVEHPWVNYTTLQQYMQGADILYLPAGECMYTIPGKFYEYLSVQRPILAVAHQNSELEHMMKRVDCGEFAVMDDIASIKKSLKILFTQHRTYTFSGAEQYTWDHMGEKYAQLINRVHEH